jgi:hypothetical protein
MMGVLEMTRKTEGSLVLSWEEKRTGEDGIDEGRQNRRSKSQTKRHRPYIERVKCGNYFFYFLFFQFLFLSFTFFSLFLFIFYGFYGGKQKQFITDDRGALKTYKREEKREPRNKRERTK